MKLERSYIAGIGGSPASAVELVFYQVQDHALVRRNSPAQRFYPGGGGAQLQSVTLVEGILADEPDGAAADAPAGRNLRPGTSIPAIATPITVWTASPSAALARRRTPAATGRLAQ